MFVLSLESMGMKYAAPLRVDQDNGGYPSRREPGYCCNALAREVGLSAHRIREYPVDVVFGEPFQCRSEDGGSPRWCGQLTPTGSCDRSLRARSPVRRERISARCETLNCERRLTETSVGMSHMSATCCSKDLRKKMESANSPSHASSSGVNGRPASPSNITSGSSERAMISW